jgi:hypothetical protein
MGKEGGMNMAKSKENPISARKQQKRLDEAERGLIKVQKRTPDIAKRHNQKAK